MDYVITDHAAERFRKRIRPDLPTVFAARVILTALARASTPIREKTFAGQDQRKVTEPPCVLVCKRDNPRTIAVVTVLGPGEVCTEEESAEFVDEFIAAYRRQIATSALADVRAQLTTPEPEGMRKMVEAAVRRAIPAHIDRILELKRAEVDRALAAAVGKGVRRQTVKELIVALRGIAVHNPDVAAVLARASQNDPDIMSWACNPSAADTAGNGVTR